MGKGSTYIFKYKIAFRLNQLPTYGANYYMVLYIYIFYKVVKVVLPLNLILACEFQDYSLFVIGLSLYFKIEHQFSSINNGGTPVMLNT